MLTVRIALGDRNSLLAQVVTVAAIVALLAASLSISSLLDTSLGTGIPSPFAPILAEVGSELASLVLLWSVPVWLVLVAANYFLSIQSLRELGPTVGLVSDMGSRARVRRLTVARVSMVAVLGLLVGWPFGVVVTQVAFRFAAFAASAPYFVPALGVPGFVEVACLTFAAAALGAASPLIRAGGRRR
jgi:hypothetical protein